MLSIFGTFRRLKRIPVTFADAGNPKQPNMEIGSLRVSGNNYCLKWTWHLDENQVLLRKEPWWAVFHILFIFLLFIGDASLQGILPLAWNRLENKIREEFSSVWHGWDCVLYLEQNLLFLCYLLPYCWSIISWISKGNSLSFEYCPQSFIKGTSFVHYFQKLYPITMILFIWDNIDINFSFI